MVSDHISEQFKTAAQVQIAAKRGVTKAAIHQLENRPLTKISIGSLVSYIQALGYPIDEDWIARTLAEALPTTAAAV